MEAVLWHGGEAERSRRAVQRFNSARTGRAGEVPRVALGDIANPGASPRGRCSASARRSMDPSGIQSERYPSLDAESLHRLDVVLVDQFGLGKRGDRCIHARLAQQVQHRIGRAIGVVGDVVRVGAGELVPRDESSPPGFRPRGRGAPPRRRRPRESRCTRGSRRGRRGWMSRVVSTSAAGRFASASAVPLRGRSSSSVGSVASLTIYRIWFLTLTAFANGHRLRPITARSIQRRVAAMTSLFPGPMSGCRAQVSSPSRSSHPLPRTCGSVLPAPA